MKSVNLIPSNLHQKYWLVSADMGYGHQRAISPLRATCAGKVTYLMPINLLKGHSEGATVSGMRCREPMNLCPEQGTSH